MTREFKTLAMYSSLLTDFTAQSYGRGTRRQSTEWITLPKFKDTSIVLL